MPDYFFMKVNGQRLLILKLLEKFSLPIEEKLIHYFLLSKY